MTICVAIQVCFFILFVCVVGLVGVVDAVGVGCLGGCVVAGNTDFTVVYCCHI